MILTLVCICAFLLGYFTCRVLDRLGSAPTHRYRHDDGTHESTSDALS